MRSRPKDGIEDRQYLRQNVVASVRGFPRQGGLRVGQEGMPKLDFQPLLREQRSELAEFYPKGKQVSQVQSHRRNEGFLLKRPFWLLIGLAGAPIHLSVSCFHFPRCGERPDASNLVVLPGHSSEPMLNLPGCRKFARAHRETDQGGWKREREGEDPQAEEAIRPYHRSSSEGENHRCNIVCDIVGSKNPASRRSVYDRDD